MQAKTKIRDADHGAKALTETVRRNGRGGARLHVGIVGENASTPHEAEPHADGTPSKASTITMGELGTIFEMGLGNNPERSWLRAYVDENAQRLMKMFERIGEQVAQKKMTREQGLELLGLQIVGEIKQRIRAGIMPPLAKSTLKKKGPNKTTPLIMTSQWIGSINHLVSGGR